MVRSSYLFIGLFLLFLTLAFFVRVFFVPRWVLGDILVYAEWGEKFWKYGSGFFYFSEDWYYSFPTQLPLTSLMVGGAFWLFDHKHVLAQIHNVIGIVPAVFIDYFYDMEQPIVWAKNGYLLLLKLPAILADLGIGVVIYKVLLMLGKSRTGAMFGVLVYLFNPVTVFLSGVWGQPESVLAFFGLLAFVLLIYGKVYVSLPLFILSLYTKPTWAVFIPLYLFLLFTIRPKLSGIFIGVAASFVLFLSTTMPFSGGDVFGFTRKVVVENMLPSSKGTAKASVSAFNLYSVFFNIDKTLETEYFLVVPANILGVLGFVFVNLFSFYFIKGEKDKLFATIVAIFTIGLGAFLFLTNMLERYFFASFAPMIIVLFYRPRVFLPVVLINIAVFLNLIYAYFRRSWDPMTAAFTANNLFLIRLLSTAMVASWFCIVTNLAVLKYSVQLKSGFRKKLTCFFHDTI